jgi:hypothetical protein
VARILCWICLAVADDRAKGWRAYRSDEEPEPLILFCCPTCAGHKRRPLLELDRASEQPAA